MHEKVETLKNQSNLKFLTKLGITLSPSSLKSNHLLNNNYNYLLIM